MVETDTLTRYIRVFSELGGQLRNATQKRILVEVALIKLCCPAMEPARDGILDRIRVLEKKVEDSLAGISQEGLKALAGAAGAYGAGFPGNAAGFGSGEEAQAEPPMTDAVPEDSLAIARARQVNKTDWNDKRSK